MRRAALAAVVAGVLAAAPAAGAVQPRIACSPSCDVKRGEAVTFTATIPPGSAVSDYAWDLDGDGVYGTADAEPQGPRATVALRTFDVAGRFLVAVRVRDAAGVADSDRVQVTVSEPPPPPPTTPPGTTPPTGPSEPAAPGFAPPPATADLDGDHATGDGDLCPTTPPRVRARLHGCSLADVLVAPGALVDAATKRLDTALGSLRRRLPSTKRAQARVTATAEALERAETKPCDAARAVRRRQATTRRGIDALTDAVDAGRRTIARQATRALVAGKMKPGDSSAYDIRYALLGAAEAKVADANREVAGVARLLGAACDAEGKRLGKPGRIVSIQGVSATLDDGTVLVPATTHKLEGMAVGAEVVATGRALPGNVLVTETVKPRRKAPGVLNLGPCKFNWTVAPVQSFAFPSQVVYEDRRGYLDGAKYRLEAGMGFGATRGPSCTGDDYALEIWVDEEVADGITLSSPIGYLRGEGLEAPAVIPKTLVSKKAVLRLDVYEFDCEIPKDVEVCDGATLVSQEKLPLRIHEQGSLASVVYDRTIFSVEDGSPTDFDVATFERIDAPALPGATGFGWGYAVGAGGASSYPQGGWIFVGDQLAVHDDVPSATAPGGLFSAYAQGFRNGQVYHYLAMLPKLVTDRLEDCPNADSYYRLPWKNNSLATVTQGNNGTVTHNLGQKYAFDFRMNLLDFGYATRGGVVTWVVENRTKNIDPDVVKAGNGIGLDLWIPGNVLLIRHQDGTSSFYTHMVPAGVFPKKGDVVERGERIIVIGQTGNASGPHLHYHVTSTGTDEVSGNGNSVQIKFEARAYFSFEPLSCVIPGKGSAWISNNAQK